MVRQPARAAHRCLAGSRRRGWHAGGVDPYPAKRGALRLYFINLGGYERGLFGEAHRYVLVSARNKADAKALGKQHMQTGWLKPHTDAVLSVDDCLAIDCVDGLYVHLVEGPHKPVVSRNDYIPL